MHATNISTSDLGLTVPERRAVRWGAVHGWGFAFAVRVAVASSSFLIGSTMVLFVGAAWFTEPNAGVDALVFLGAAALWTVLFTLIALVVALAVAVPAAAVSIELLRALRASATAVEWTFVVLTAVLGAAVPVWMFNSVLENVELVRALIVAVLFVANLCIGLWRARVSRDRLREAYPLPVEPANR